MIYMLPKIIKISLKYKLLASLTREKNSYKEVKIKNWYIICLHYVRVYFNFYSFLMVRKI